MKSKPKILLVNPPIYDFTAYDYWLKPLGLLSIAGTLSNSADLQLFDFLDRSNDFYADKPKFKSNDFGTGSFYSEKIPKPLPLKNIPRHYNRFGLPQKLFIEYLRQNPPADFAMIQTVMTYWYPGYKEVIDTIKTHWPKTKIILGGPYAILCAKHAESLNADLVVTETGLDKLFNYIGIANNKSLPPSWQLYKKLDTAAMRISTGCPFKCTYCSVPNIYGSFKSLSIQNKLREVELLVKLGVKNIAFYDDALLYKSSEVLVPFLSEIIKRKLSVNFHSPNALNARFVTGGLAELMVKAGFKTFCLGFESHSENFQKLTGSKVFSDELSSAVDFFLAAGADKNNITAYQILGHPNHNIQETENSMKFISSLGIRIMLSDFSPIPGTPDGEYCRKFIDMDEPLNHNKTAFPIMTIGYEAINKFKNIFHNLSDKL
ncbi:MAG: radical SAM protein [Anaerohalosphaeraceae bacterium]|nr:radical SAM protein [Anaerohalosphaeraceae bacterium]